ncbi:MAG: hypothetical protein LW713_04565 [Acetobacteraceae bacterium]|jgi:hypothetical protein|nr:hypothetical protein [Acetobacteraceae bacterium]
MSDVLAARVAQPDMQGLTEWQVAEILNTPDVQFGTMPIPFSCRSIAAPARISGELKLLDIIQKQGQIPADISPTGQAQAVPTSILVAIGTLVQAAEDDWQIDPSMPTALTAVSAMLTAIENMGLLSDQTKAAILAQTTRFKSWAEANGVEVTAETVSQARGRI